MNTQVGRRFAWSVSAAIGITLSLIGTLLVTGDDAWGRRIGNGHQGPPVAQKGPSQPVQSLRNLLQGRELSPSKKHPGKPRFADVKKYQYQTESDPQLKQALTQYFIPTKTFESMTDRNGVPKRNRISKTDGELALDDSVADQPVEGIWFPIGVYKTLKGQKDPMLSESRQWWQGELQKRKSQKEVADIQLYKEQMKFAKQRNSLQQISDYGFEDITDSSVRKLPEGITRRYNPKTQQTAYVVNDAYLQQDLGEIEFLKERAIEFLGARGTRLQIGYMLQDDRKFSASGVTAWDEFIKLVTPPSPEPSRENIEGKLPVDGEELSYDAKRYEGLGYEDSVYFINYRQEENKRERVLPAYTDTSGWKKDKYGWVLTRDQWVQLVPESRPPPMRKEPPATSEVESTLKILDNTNEILEANSGNAVPQIVDVVEQSSAAAGDSNKSEVSQLNLSEETEETKNPADKSTPSDTQSTDPSSTGAPTSSVMQKTTPPGVANNDKETPAASPETNPETSPSPATRTSEQPARETIRKPFLSAKDKLAIATLISVGVAVGGGIVLAVTDPADTGSGDWMTLRFDELLSAIRN